MDLSRHFILLNGEPKTLQIDSIIRNGASGYRVRFKNNGKSYNYGKDKVVWLSNPEWLDPTNSHVFIGGSKQNDIKEIWKFSCGTNCYWRITHINGYVQEGAHPTKSVAGLNQTPTIPDRKRTECPLPHAVGF